MPSIPSLRSLLPAGAAATLAALACAATAHAAPDPFPITESFTHTTLQSGWVTSGSAALTAGATDADGNGWLRLTPATNNAFGTVRYQNAFPSDRGILAEFEYATYGGTHADGLTFFLYDGATTESSWHPGAAGGSLGYTSCNSTPGLSGAYMGVAFDEFGNYVNSGFCSNNGGFASGLQPNRVGIRGSAAAGFPYLTSAATSQSLEAPRGSARKLKISITPDRKLSVFITYPNGQVQTVTDRYQLPPDAPSTFRMGFVASTGGQNNVHEIRNTQVVLPADLETTVRDATPSSSGAGRGRRTWEATVTNTSTNPVTGAAVEATAPVGGLSDVSWTCTGCSGATSGTGLPDTTTDLAANASAVYTITGTVADDADTAQLRVAASQPAGGKTGDPDPTNDAATARTVLTPKQSTSAYVAPTFTLSPAGVATVTSMGGPYLGGDVTTSRQWQRCAPDGTACVDIAGATGATYATTAADAGSTLRLRVVASNTSGSTTGDSAAFVLPDTALTTTPPARSASSTATFAATTGGPNGTTVACSLDGAAWAACPTGGTFTGLADGDHELRVRATYGGLVDPTPATYAWTVDTGAPDTHVTGGPDDVTTATAASFDVDGVDGGTGVDRLECSLDGAAFAPCGPTADASGLADGEHTLRARAVDRVGNVDPSPAIRTWTVDTTAPTTTATARPDALTKATDATVSVAGDDGSGSGVVSYERSVDGGDWEAGPDTTTLSDLADGEHRVAYRAVDRAGNRSEPVVTTWTVDTRLAAAIGRPADGARLGTATPEVTTQVDEGAHQVLLVDGALVDERDAGADAATIAVGPLADGEHTITLRARDAAGNVVEDVHVVHVDTTAPAAPQVTGGPTGTTGERDVRFTLAGEPGATLECRLDDAAAWEPCDDGASYAGLADGPHVLHVRQTDAAGNRSDVGDVPFTVDTRTAVALGGVPTGPVAHAPKQLALTGEPGATATLVVDGVEVARGTFDEDGRLTLPLPDLGTGAHAVRVAVRDAAGNVAEQRTQLLVDADPPAAPAPASDVPTRVEAGDPVTLAVAVEDGATLECSLDGATWAPCSSPVAVPGLEPGDHVLRVRQTDAVGNVGAVRELRWSVASRQAPAVPATTPAVPAPAGGVLPATASAPVQCVSRRAITIHWSLPRGARAARTRLVVDGRVRALGRSARSARIDMASRPKQVVRVQVRVRTADGRLVGTTRSYRTCTPRETMPPLRTLRLAPVPA